MPATWEILLMNVVFMEETGTEKKIQPESTEMNGCTCTQ